MCRLPRKIQAAVVARYPVVDIMRVCEMRRRIPLGVKCGTAIKFPVVGNRDLKLARWPVRHVQRIWWRWDWWISRCVQVALFFYARCLLLDVIK